METVQQNGRFTLFSGKFHFNIYLFSLVVRLNGFPLFLDASTKLCMTPLVERGLKKLSLKIANWKILKRITLEVLPVLTLNEHLIDQRNPSWLL